MGGLFVVVGGAIRECIICGGDIFHNYVRNNNYIKVDIREYHASVTAGNYTPVTITVPDGKVIAKIPVITHCSDKPDIYSPMLQTATRLLIMSSTTQEIGVTVYSFYI